MSAPTRKPERLAYLVVKYPTLSETFIYDEVQQLCSLGLQVDLYALYATRQDPHPRFSSLSQRQHTLPPLLSWACTRAHARAWIHAPRRTGGALVALISATWRHPLVMLKSLYAFGKAVPLADVLRTRGVRHIHAHWATMPAAAAWVSSRLLGIPFSFTAHAWDLYKESAGLPAKLRACAFAVTISNYNRAYMRTLVPDLPSDRIHVVHCGVDLDVFGGEPRSQAEPPLILFVGRLVEKKGARVLVQACRLLAERGTEFECVLVGSGPERQALEKDIARAQLEGRVSLVGSLPQQEVKTLLDQASVFALPCIVDSKGNRDGIPVALMEAMASSVPVVSTRLSGIPELVKDRVSGLLVEPNDSAGLAAAIERLLGDEDLRQALSFAARQRIEIAFSVAHSARQLARLFALTAQPQSCEAGPVDVDWKG